MQKTRKGFILPGGPSDGRAKCTVKVDLLVELARLARGLPTLLPLPVVLQWAAQWARIAKRKLKTMYLCHLSARVTPAL